MKKRILVITVSLLCMLLLFFACPNPGSSKRPPIISYSCTDQTSLSIDFEVPGGDYDITNLVDNPCQ